MPEYSGFEWPRLQVNNYERAQPEMVEKQVNTKVLTADIQWKLTSDEGKTYAELQQELPDVVEQASFEFTLLGLGRKGQEIEIVRIFQDLLREIRLRLWQGTCEVRQRSSLPMVQAAFDLQDEDVAAPAVSNCLFGIPQPLFGGFQLLDQREVVVPGNLCKRRLHNCLILSRFGECPHVLEISGR